MNLYHEVIVISWLVFFIAWVVLATVFGGSFRRNDSSRMLGIRLLLVIGVVFGLRFSGHIPMHQFEDQTTRFAAVGAVLCILGLMFATWARIVLGRNWGMPMTVHEAPELITSGPYHYVRHPIYTGLIAMWLGTLLVYPLTMLLGAAIIAYSIFSALREEHDMEQRFPEAYPEYRKRSKMLLPFLF